MILVSISCHTQHHTERDERQRNTRSFHSVWTNVVVAHRMSKTMFLIQEVFLGTRTPPVRPDLLFGNVCLSSSPAASVSVVSLLGPSPWRPPPDTGDDRDEGSDPLASESSLGCWKINSVINPNRILLLTATSENHKRFLERVGVEGYSKHVL